MKSLASSRAGVLHYRVDGPAGAPAILFGNSLGTDLRLWDATIEAMPKGYRYIRFDKRGHGLSQPPNAGFSIDDLAADALEILDALGVERFAYAGVSIGGLIGQALAKLAGDRLSAAVLMDTGAKIGTEDLWTGRIAQVRDGGVGAMAEAIVDRWFSDRYKSDVSRLSPWRAMVSSASDTGYIGCCEAIRDADFTEFAPQISIPTLVMWGAVDISTPPAVNRTLAALIPNAQEFEAAEIGHLPCAEDPVLTAKQLTAFFASHGVSPAV